MTKKDYITIARIIEDCIELDPYVIQNFKLNYFIDSLSHYFKQDNPNFNEEKFKEACGL